MMDRPPWRCHHYEPRWPRWLGLRSRRACCIGIPNTPMHAPFRREVQSFVGRLDHFSQGRAGAPNCHEKPLVLRFYAVRVSVPE